MKNNNIEKQLEKDTTYINTCKTKYFFIGFITGIIPFILIIIILNSLSNLTTPFKESLVIVGLITAFINGLTLKRLSFIKLNELLDLKYHDISLQKK